MSKRNKTILLIVFVIALLLSIPQVSKALAKGVGSVLSWPEETMDKVGTGVSEGAQVAVAVVVAVVCLKLAVVALASTVLVAAVVGVVLAAVALVAVGFIAYKVGGWFGWWGSEEEELPKGQKPDNVRLNGPM